jgi:hypothetical protein
MATSSAFRAASYRDRRGRMPSGSGAVARLSTRRKELAAWRVPSSCPSRLGGALRLPRQALQPPAPRGLAQVSAGSPPLPPAGCHLVGRGAPRRSCLGPARPASAPDRPGDRREDAQDSNADQQELQSVERDHRRLRRLVPTRPRGPPDAPERACSCLHADPTALRCDLDLAPVHHVERPIWAKLAVRRTLEALMRQLGGQCPRLPAIARG